MVWDNFLHAPTTLVPSLVPFGPQRMVPPPFVSNLRVAGKQVLGRFPIYVLSDVKDSAEHFESFCESRVACSRFALRTGALLMENRTFERTSLKSQPESPLSRRVIRLCCALLLFLMTAIPAIGAAQTPQQTKPKGSEPTPEPAVSAILAAFDKYEVVAMPEAHGMKDLDDFIFSLIRTPTFSEKVNDIAVECGNSLYQPVLDGYIAGEDVPFTEVRKVWRNTTQSMCGTSGFFEQFFPLVRAINQRLPPGKRLRVLAGDPPIDWDRVKNFEDILKVAHRDAGIASVMEKEVLSKHRKALMLFGTFHLMHGVGGSAVSIYENDYPNVAFVISDLGYFDTDLPTLSSGALASWPIPSLARAKGTWLGALDLGQFLPPLTFIDKDCNVHNEFPKELQKPMADLVDAFLYLGPQDLRLIEQMPADIALDVDYRMELRRREALSGFPRSATGTLKESDQQIVNGAEHPLLSVARPPDPKAMVQSCLEHKSSSSTTP